MELPRPKHPMQVFLENIIEEAPEVPDIDGTRVKAAACQISFIGNTIAGAVKHGPVAGTFAYLTMGEDPRTKQPVMVSRVFCAEQVLYIDRVIGEPSKIKVVPTIQ